MNSTIMRRLDSLHDAFAENVARFDEAYRAWNSLPEDDHAGRKIMMERCDALCAEGDRIAAEIKALDPFDEVNK